MGVLHPTMDTPLPYRRMQHTSLDQAIVIAIFLFLRQAKNPSSEAKNPLIHWRL